MVYRKIGRARRPQKDVFVDQKKDNQSLERKRKEDWEERGGISGFLEVQKKPPCFFFPGGLRGLWDYPRRFSMACARLAACSCWPALLAPSVASPRDPSTSGDGIDGPGLCDGYGGCAPSGEDPREF